MTDLFEDDAATARRRTVAAHCAIQDTRLDAVTERRISALLHGDYTSDDVVALEAILRLPTGYLRNADTTVTVDRQVTLLLLEKAARVCGIGDFRICRRTVETASSDTQLAMLIQKIEDYRIILNPGLLDSLAEHGAPNEGERLDPRAVSVAWLITAATPAVGGAHDRDAGSVRTVESRMPTVRESTVRSRWQRWFSRI